MEMLEEFRGEDGEGMNLVEDGKSEAVGYFDKMLRKYPKSVYFRAYKAMALFGLERFDEEVKYYEIVATSSRACKIMTHLFPPL